MYLSRTCPHFHPGGYIWDFSPSPATVDDLTVAAELLSGRRLDHVMGMVPLSPDELRDRWRRYRGRKQ